MKKDLPIDQRVRSLNDTKAVKAQRVELRKVKSRKFAFRQLIAASQKEKSNDD